MQNTAYPTTSATALRAPTQPEVAENMTINRVQKIEKDILGLRDVFENNLAAILIGSMPTVEHEQSEMNNRTFLERSLTDVEVAITQLRRIAERIVI